MQSIANELTWIKKEDRAPTKEDGDFAGCVLCWHDFNGAIIQSFQRANENRFISFWMKLPAKPEE